MLSKALESSRASFHGWQDLLSFGTWERSKRWYFLASSITTWWYGTTRM
jgi:hypothetical protein